MPKRRRRNRKKEWRIQNYLELTLSGIYLCLEASARTIRIIPRKKKGDLPSIKNLEMNIDPVDPTDSS